MSLDTETTSTNTDAVAGFEKVIASLEALAAKPDSTTDDATANIDKTARDYRQHWIQPVWTMGAIEDVHAATVFAVSTIKYWQKDGATIDPILMKLLEHLEFLLPGLQQLLHLGREHFLESLKNAALSPDINAPIPTTDEKGANN